MAHILNVPDIVSIVLEDVQGFASADGKLVVPPFRIMHIKQEDGLETRISFSAKTAENLEVKVATENGG